MARQFRSVAAFNRLGADPAAAPALADFCLALFNRNEFLYMK